MKELTFEGRFESGLDQIIKGRVYAFVAIYDAPVRLGVAIANEPGYVPVPPHWCHADTVAEMDAYAERLNDEQGLSALTAMRIVCSTMGGRHFAGV